MEEVAVSNDGLPDDAAVYPAFWKMDQAARDVLRSANDLQWIMTCVSRDMRVNFKIGKSDQWNGLSWSETILHGNADDFTCGWVFGLHLRMKPPLTPGVLRDHLALSGIHVASAENRVSFDNGNRNVVLRCYILADEFPTLLLWRKVQGMDQAPGPTPSRVPKSVASRI